MTATALPDNKADLLKQMDESWLRLNGFVSALTPAQLQEPTDAAGWSIRDHLAHLVAWENGIAALLQQQPRHAGMGVGEEMYLNADIDDLNAALRESTLDVPLAKVIDDLAAAHNSLRGLVEGLPDEHLHQPYRWFLPDEPGDSGDGPIIHRISGNSHRHYDEHLTWMQGILDLHVP